MRTALYAANRSLHQLLTLTRSVPGITSPITFPLAFDKLGRFEWAPEVLLPPVGSEQRGQPVLREHYVTMMAGQLIDPTLRQLREWFEQQLS